MTNEPTNSIFIQGEITSTPTITYSREGENFYEFELTVRRHSDKSDRLTVMMPERVYKKVEGEKFITVTGEIRTRNFKDENEKNHLRIYIFAKDGYLNLEEKNDNEVTLTGFVCKKPVFRTTPLNRDICDLLIAVNRISGKRSDYIPSIVWGRSAAYAGELQVGDNITVTGRFQSRIYNKQKDGGDTEEKIAHELSISNIAKIN